MCYVCSLVIFSMALCTAQLQADDTTLQEALAKSGSNRSELERAIKEVPADEKEGMLFLIENMPDRDLTSLSADFLLENSRLTWQAVRESNWADSVPKDVVFDALLPYANINERRDQWRTDFYKRFRDVVKGAKTPSEAATRLNQKVFPTLNVKYSTQRKKADQSPLESMESGLASCTGLSVILVDACRSIGVPARIVGTPLWSNKSGNHTWVEIWDNGWHFTGACEPTGDKLNEGWFVDQASKAERDHKLHAIYAVTFRRNGQSFPMVWARHVHDVYAVNVTDRYTALRSPLPEGETVVRIRLKDDKGKRISMAVEIRNDQKNVIFTGETKDERFDSNDHLTTSAKPGTVLEIAAKEANASATVTVGDSEMIVDLTLPSTNL
jgi:hypothetical protein